MVKINSQVIVGWCVFITLYCFLWNFSIGHMMRQASPDSLHHEFSRGSLFVIGAYTACRVTLLLVLYLLLLFCLMSIMQCILPFLTHLPEIHSMLTWLSSENVLFHAVSPNLLPYHATVLASSLTIATVYALVYISDADLRDDDRWVSVVVRDALCMAAPGVLAYIGYCFFTCIIQPTVRTPSKVLRD